MNSSKRKFIHVDMDAFFAAIEEQRQPQYQGKPLVVGGRGDPSKRGVVSAASYEARKYGIKSGMPLRSAYRNCPQAIFLPVDFRKYQEISKKMKAILKEYSPLIESIGLDEAFLDVTKAKGKAEEIGKEIKRRIKNELDLTASVGIAPNKLLAKIASGLDKPDGFTVIKKEEATKILAPLSVRELWGVGKKTEAHLNSLGIRIISDLTKVPLKKLTKVFGKAHGGMLYKSSRGIDDSPVVSFRERKSLGHETTFEKDTQDLTLIKAILLKFARYLWKELKNSQRKAQTITVKIRYSTFSTHTKSYTLEKPSSSLKTIFEETLKILEKLPIGKDRKVRLIGLRLSNFKKEAKGR